MKSKLTRDQKIKTGWRMISERERMKVEIRYDDDCGNGHNTFSITGTIEEKRGKQWRDYSGGCIHEEIAKHFPDYAHLIKWHLVSSDGPMHYLSNVTYHAGDRDPWGKRKGEPIHFRKVLKFVGFPFSIKASASLIEYIERLSAEDRQQLTIEGIPHENRAGDNYKFGPKYTFQGLADVWHKCPFDTLKEAEEMREALQTLDFTITQIPVDFSEGKERDLAAARSIAVWPEATDEELTAPDLKEKLIERLPKLLEAFRADMEALGFTY